MRAKPATLRLGAVLAALGAAAACQLVAGIDDRTVYNTSDASPDVAASADGGGDLCRHPNVPGAPDLSTSSPSDSIDAVLALSKLDFGLDGGTEYGDNLDRACTCPEPDSCKRPLDMKGMPLAAACDDPGGVDNAGRAIFSEFVATGFISESLLSGAVAQGLAGVFVRISHYNGQPNDASVEVSVYASLGFTGYPDAGPKFDGSDVWFVDEGSVNGGSTDTPRYTASEAYVSNGTLVASLNFPIILGGGYVQPVVIEIKSGLITAQVQMSGANVSGIKGSLAGRWPVERLLTSFQNVPDPLDTTKTKRLCGTDPTFALIKPPICNGVDITADPTNDGTGICDAISIGLGFEAVPAKFGPVLPTPDSGAPCGVGYVATCP